MKKPLDTQQLIQNALTTPSKIIAEDHSKQILASWGIPVVSEKRVQTPSDAALAARQIGFPVVLKGLARGMAHKTESGLVVVGIDGEAEVEGLARK